MQFQKPLKTKSWFTLSATGLFALLMVTLLTGAWSGNFSLNPFIEDLNKRLDGYNQYKPEDRLYVHTDRPFYNPGDDIWFSAYIRDGRTLKPSSKSDIVYVELINPRGGVQHKLTLISKDGVAAGDFSIGADDPGGMYKIKAYTKWQENDSLSTAFEKDIQVQDVVLPNLKMKLDFEREAYGAGDHVSAKLDLQTNENEPLGDYSFNFTASLQGVVLTTGKATTSPSGVAYIKFDLPAALASNDGIVNVMIDYNGLTEAVSRSIPIVLNDIDLQLLPEGGDLVSGLKSRVAFRALNEFGKPADVEGVVTDAAGRTVSTFKSFHQGMGAFDITPGGESAYTIQITKPEGVKETFTLPEALPRGYVLNVKAPVKDGLPVVVRTTETEELSIVAQVRGEMYWATALKAVPGENTFTIPTGAFPAGVAQVTVFDSKGIARAERLAFTNYSRKLDIKITTDKQKYLPREKVNMTLRVLDDRGIPMPGTYSLAVVSDQLLSFADDKQGTVLSKMLLEHDLKEEVYEPSFYFDPKEEKAQAALDYLLMTSGWRRFTWEEVLADMRPALVHAGERAVFRGTVLDPNTNEPISNATVMIPGTTTKTVTNAKGEFEIPARDYLLENKQSLEIQAEGYSNSAIYGPALGAAVTGYLYKPGGLQYDYYADEGAGVVEMEAVEVVAAAPPQFAVDAVQAQVLMRADVQNVAIRGARGVDNKKGKEAGAGKNRERNEAALPVAADPAPMKVAENKPVALEQKLVKDIKAAEKKEIAVEQQEEPDAEFLLMAEDARWGGLGDNGIAANQNMRQPIGGQVPVFHRARQFASPSYEAKATMPAERTDFRKTVYWNPEVKTDRSGKATVTFYNNDDITSFRAIAEGFAADGMAGRGEHVFFTQMPFSMITRLPVEIVSEDIFTLPVTLKNNTTASISGDLKVVIPQNLEAIGNVPQEVTLAAGETRTLLLQYQVRPGQICGGNMEVSFHSLGHSDALAQNIKIVPKGFPVSYSLSGSEISKQFTFDVLRLVKGSMEVKVEAYPTVMADLLKGIESILNEPYGCFEQTSSSSYPNVMVLQYLRKMEGADPKVLQRANELLDKGYKRLITFETKEKGYEWFGGNPGHEALTAYGLMQFNDMKDVYAGVDDKMIERTSAWLMSRRDGKGNFQRNPRALDSFGGASQEVTNAYIVYALAESGNKDLKKEADMAFAEALKTKDAYQLALAANYMYALGETTRSAEALTALAAKQSADGGFTGAAQSITRSGGISLDVETSSLALMAMLQSPGTVSMETLTKTMKFITSKRSNYGGFGSTQATILALKSLARYAEFSKRTPSGGTIEMYVDGNKVAERNYEAGVKDAITMTGLEQFVGEGNHTMEVRFVNCKEALPWSVGINYFTNLPASSEKCKVSIDTKLMAVSAKMGETVRMNAKLTNKTQEGQPMTMAVLGLPAGLTAQPWQLKELQEKNVFDFYEVKGNTVICYYRQMKPGEVREINLDLKADIPGKFDAPASCAYLYYTAEDKHWAGLPAVTVANPM